MPAAFERRRWSSGRVLQWCVAALYLLSFPYHASLRSPNELSRIWLTRSLVDHHSVAIDQTLQEFGMVGDLSCTLTVEDSSGIRKLHSCVEPVDANLRVVERHFYSSKAPLLSFLAVPLYALQKLGGPVNELGQVFLGRLFLSVIPTLLMLVFLRRFLGAFIDAATVEVIVPTYALGTMAFSYATSFMSHQLTAVLVFATLYSAFQSIRRALGRWGFALSGAFAGATVACEYTGVLFIVPIAVYVGVELWPSKRRLLEAVLLVVVGSAPFLLGLMAYHRVCFGGAFVSGYKFLNDAAYQPWHLGGFLGIRYPDFRALGLSLFSPLRGLFTLSPFLLLSLLGLGALRKVSRSLFIMVLLALLGSLYFTASFSYDSWGWTVGPRHLTALLPLLLLPISFAFAQQKSTLAKGVAGGFCVSSIVSSSLVCFVNYVPPELSTSLFGLAVPLLLDNVYPVTILAAVVPNPWSGLVWLAVLSVGLAAMISQLKKNGFSLAVLALTVLLHLGLLKLLTRDDAADRGARNFIKSAWSAPNGIRLKVW